MDMSKNAIVLYGSPALLMHICGRMRTYANVCWRMLFVSFFFEFFLICAWYLRCYRQTHVKHTDTTQRLAPKAHAKLTDSNKLTTHTKRLPYLSKRDGSYAHSLSSLSFFVPRTLPGRGTDRQTDRQTGTHTHTLRHTRTNDTDSVINIHMYIYIYMYVYVCIYIYVCMYNARTLPD